MNSWFTGGRAFFVVLLAALLFTGCLSTTAKRTMPPPWVPAEGEAQHRLPPVGEVAPLFYLSEAPVIDGSFDEWDGLVSAEPWVSVYGGGHVPDDASAVFALATDGTALYIYSDVTDDQPNENPLSPAMAWRNDSVEIFVGTETGRHQRFAYSDSQIRIVPVSRDDITAYSLAINDVDYSEQTDARVVFSENGYTIEAVIGLDLLRIERLQPGQKVRVEFQINDGDETERDRLVHWMSEKDDPWFDPSVWGDGEVVDAGGDQ